MMDIINRLLTDLENEQERRSQLEIQRAQLAAAEAIVAAAEAAAKK